MDRASMPILCVSLPLSGSHQRTMLSSLHVTICPSDAISKLPINAVSMPNDLISLPSLTSHTRMNWSSSFCSAFFAPMEQEYRFWPLGAHARQRMPALCPSKIPFSLPRLPLMSQARMDLSALPEKSVSPSGVKARQLTAAMCPSQVQTSLPPETCQTCTFMSVLPAASRLPSDRKSVV